MFSGDSKDNQKCRKLSRSSEVNQELSIVQREVSVEVKNKARALEVTRNISRSLEQGFKVQGGQDGVE